MRARDVRAIAFCVVTTTLLALVVYLFSGDLFVTAAATGAYLLWILTRPRMIRVIQRARGAPDWSNYFKD
jgi:hypothetical protein